MKSGFPKRHRSTQIGEAGVNLLSSIINDSFNWIFRPNNNQTDFGIDAYIDIVADDGFVLGLSFAVQIKAGNSFFKQKTKNGYIFYGKEKHLNYYINHQIPILIILCDLDNDTCYWSEFDKKKIEKTDKGWKLNVPFCNKLNSRGKKEILALLPEAKDHGADLESFWSENDSFKKSKNILYTINKSDITRKNIKPIKDFFERLQVNDNLFRSCQEKIIISVYGYCNDYRELFEIREVRKWFKKAELKLDPWFYLLESNFKDSSLQLFISCVCFKHMISHEGRITKDDFDKLSTSGSELPRYNIKLSNELLLPFLTRNFERQNKISQRLGLSEEEKNKITKNINRTLGIE